MTPIFRIFEAQPFSVSHVWEPAVRAAKRSIIIAATVAISSIVPNMERMVALTGACAFSLLCFVLPGAFYLRLRPQYGGTYERYLAMALIPLGVIGFVCGVIGWANSH